MIRTLNFVSVVIGSRGRILSGINLQWDKLPFVSKGHSGCYAENRLG